MCPDGQQREISIHSLHTEGDNCAINRPYRTWKFQSTPSTRRETIRGNTYYALDNISIHSLHTEGDTSVRTCLILASDFNPLPPHGGRHSVQTRSNTPEDISIHSLHTEGDEKKLARERQQRISIHSLHTEGDDTEKTQAQINSISIHSLHTEGDNNRSFKNLIIINFNPLPPHGGRLVESPRSEQNLSFQSTPSTRRETLIPWRFFPGNYHFNPLPPHGGRPAETGGEIATAINFNPLPPHGGRQDILLSHSSSEIISIHSLHTEGDLIWLIGLMAFLIFQSTPSTRRETVP